MWRRRKRRRKWGMEAGRAGRDAGGWGGRGGRWWDVGCGRRGWKSVWSRRWETGLML